MLRDWAKRMLGHGGAAGAAVPPTQLDGHHRTLKEAEQFGEALKKLQPALEAFADNTQGMCEGTCSFLRHTPSPIQWRQQELTQPAEVVPQEIPSGLAPLLQPEHQAALEDTIPSVVDRSLKVKLLRPLEEWQTVLHDCQERLARLEKDRPHYDSMRAHLAAARQRVEEEEARLPVEYLPEGQAPTVLGPTPSGGGTAPVRAAAQRQELHRLMDEFEDDMIKWEVAEHDLYELLVWLVGQGVRLKGLLADAVVTMREALLTLGAHPQLLLPLPAAAKVSAEQQLKQAASRAVERTKSQMERIRAAAEHEQEAAHAAAAAAAPAGPGADKGAAAGAVRSSGAAVRPTQELPLPEVMAQEAALLQMGTDPGVADVATRLRDLPPPPDITAGGMEAEVELPHELSPQGPQLEPLAPLHPIS